MIKWIALACGLFASVGAQAYCVHNQLPDRTIIVVQEPHPDSLRNERRFRATLKPGESQCCAFHRLDCNPRGRDNSVVNLAIIIPGEPAHQRRDHDQPPQSGPRLRLRRSADRGQ